jgi:hypothetical protein
MFPSVEHLISPRWSKQLTKTGSPWKAKGPLSARLYFSRIKDDWMVAVRCAFGKRCVATTGRQFVGGRYPLLHVRCSHPDRQSFQTRTVPLVHGYVDALCASRCAIIDGSNDKVLAIAKLGFSTLQSYPSLGLVWPGCGFGVTVLFVKGWIASVGVRGTSELRNGDPAAKKVQMCMKVRVHYLNHSEQISSYLWACSSTVRAGDS